MMTNRLLLLLLTLMAMAFAGVSPATAAEPTFPSLSGRVVDQARLLTPESRAALDEKLAQLQTTTGRQMVVVTLQSLQGYEIEDFGYRLGRAWGIGSAEDDDGVLLIVAPNERKVRLEVGYGLEPVLTDAMSNHIIQTDILPAFREGGYVRGINAGIDAVQAQLRLDPADAEARAAQVGPSEAQVPFFPGLVVTLIFLFFFLNLLRGAGRRGRRRRGAGGLGQILVWGAAQALSQGRSGQSWSSGGGGFRGGFSGGGGSFGGGGASGGW